MEGYIVRIISRTLETAQQKEIPNVNFFTNRPATDAFYEKITSAPYKFHPEQITVHRVSLRYEEAIRYPRPVSSNQCPKCTEFWRDCRCPPAERS